MKKLLALLLAAALLMTLSVSVLADGESVFPAEETFEGFDIGAQPNNDSIGKWGYWLSNENGSATIVDSGNENYGKVLKLSGSACSASVGTIYSAGQSSVLTDFRFSIKFDDMDSDKTVGTYYRAGGNKAQGLVVFKKDGTVTIHGKMIEGFKYETGVWYDVSYVFTHHQQVKVTISDESGNKISDVVGFYSFEGTYYGVYIAASLPDDTTFYVDKLSVGPADKNAFRLMAETYDYAADGMELKGGDGNGSTTRGYNYRADGAATSMAVATEDGKKVLKITTDPANSDAKIWGWDKKESQYANGLIDLDLKIADKSVTRAIIATFYEDTEKYALVFNTDGTITVGDNKISGFNYKTGVWYRVKVYVCAATGDVKATLSSADESHDFYGKINATASCIHNIKYASSGTTSVASVTYIDNLKFREFFPKNSDFYQRTSNFGFDDVTTLPTGYLTDGYSNFTLHHNNSGTVAGTTVNIDGRKALQASRISESTNTTLKWFEMDEIDPAANTLEFDLMLDENNVKKSGASISCESAGITFNNDGEIVCSGETLGNYNYGDWYRISISFDFAGKKYDLKIVNLDSKQSFTKTVNLAEDSTLSQIKLMYIIANLDAGDKFYVDNVRLGRSGALYSMDQTWYEEGVAPHLGATILFNHNIDPANQNNEIVLNGVRYTGAEANKFIDARYMGCASLTGLDGDTTYDVEYKLYDMFGNYAEGKTTISTCEKYTFSDITLSAETLVAGDITASLTGKISCDETANLIFALYEKGAQRMCSVKMVNISYSDASAIYTATLTVPDDNKEYEVRAFLWDKNLSPLSVEPVGLIQQ